MHDDISEATYSNVYLVDEITVHPVWTVRQTTSNTLGDGDELGVI